MVRESAYGGAGRESPSGEDKMSHFSKYCVNYLPGVIAITWNGTIDCCYANNMVSVDSQSIESGCSCIAIININNSLSSSPMVVANTV